MAEPAYTLPQATLHEHFYLLAIVTELQGIRAALEALPQAIQNLPGGLVGAAAQVAQDEIVLREQTKPAKPRRGDP